MFHLLNFYINLYSTVFETVAYYLLTYSSAVILLFGYAASRACSPNTWKVVRAKSKSNSSNDHKSNHWNGNMKIYIINITNIQCNYSNICTNSNSTTVI